jgi:hypothetical protein
MRATFKQILYKLGLFIIFILTFSSCASYKISLDSFQQEDIKDDSIQDDKEYPVSEKNHIIIARKNQALNHWLYRIIPRHRCQIRWYDLGHWCTWMLFGNDDDGIFGEEPTANFRPTHKIHFMQALAWELRNPLHNFCFYVIGTAHYCNSEYTILEVTPEHIEGFHYRDHAITIFASENSSLYLALHGWKPFISLRLIYNERRKGDFYLGWRCRGNFGIKCVLFGRRHKPCQCCCWDKKENFR